MNRSMDRCLKIVASIFVALVLTAFGYAAFAQVQPPVVDTQQWWQNLLVQIISFVAAVATPVLSVLAISLLRKWGVKLEREKVEWIASKAIGYGEQKAKNALKDGKPLEGPEIMKMALHQAAQLAEGYKADKKLAAYLENLIEAKLGEKVIEQGGANIVAKANGGQ